MYLNRRVFVMRKTKTRIRLILSSFSRSLGALRLFAVGFILTFNGCCLAF